MNTQKIKFSFISSLGLLLQQTEANEFVNKTLKNKEPKINLGDLSTNDIEDQVKKDLQEYGKDNLFSIYVCRNPATKDITFKDKSEVPVRNEKLRYDFVPVYSREFIEQVAKDNNLKIKVFETKEKNALNLALVYKLASDKTNPDTDKTDPPATNPPDDTGKKNDKT